MSETKNVDKENNYSIIEQDVVISPEAEAAARAARRAARRLKARWATAEVEEVEAVVEVAEVEVETAEVEVEEPKKVNGSNKVTLLKLDIPLINSPNLLIGVPDESIEKPKVFFANEDEDEVRKDVKTLAHYISLLLNSVEISNKYSLLIDNKAKSILNTLLETDNYFDNVDALFKNIIKDNKIDADDVPSIMILLVELYTILKNKKIDFNKHSCGWIIKIIFTVAIKEGIIHITDKEHEIISSLYNIIQMSVQLSQMGDSDNKKKGGLFECLRKCFK